MIIDSYNNYKQNGLFLSIDENDKITELKLDNEGIRDIFIEKVVFNVDEKNKFIYKNKYYFNYD